MNVEPTDAAASSIAAGIGEPARARMLYCLVDGHARTSTELEEVADVAPSTASVHLQRLFGYACLDWSERRPHLGGALGAAILRLALKRKWVRQDLDSRALTITISGRRELQTRFGLLP